MKEPGFVWLDEEPPEWVYDMGASEWVLLRAVAEARMRAMDKAIVREAQEDADEPR